MNSPQDLEYIIAHRHIDSEEIAEAYLNEAIEYGDESLIESVKRDIEESGYGLNDKGLEC